MWCSPENLEGPSEDNPHFAQPPSDIWSFGVVLWEMVTGEVPWASRGGLPQILAAMARGTLPIPPTCDARLRGIMQRCWARTAADRPTAAQLVIELSAML